MPSVPEPLSKFIKTHRRRIARVVAIIAFGVVGYHIWSSTPRDVEFRFDLGPRHERVTSMWVSYQEEGEEVGGVRFDHRRGSPRLQSHVVSLAPGRYAAVIGVYQGDRLKRHRRSFVVPTEGVLRMRLFEERLSQHSSRHRLGN